MSPIDEETIGEEDKEDDRVEEEDDKDDRLNGEDDRLELLELSRSIISPICFILLLSLGFNLLMQRFTRTYNRRDKIFCNLLQTQNLQKFLTMGQITQLGKICLVAQKNPKNFMTSAK